MTGQATLQVLKAATPINPALSLIKIKVARKKKEMVGAAKKKKKKEAV